jgi:hypothetical protein
MAIGFREVITFTTRYRMAHHGWLARIAPGAALDARTRIVANVRWRFARAIRFTTTADLRQPLLVRDAGPPKKRHSRCSNARPTGAAGVSPPWSGNRAGSTERFLLNEDARMPRGAYVPQSWWFCGANVCRRNCDLCDTRTLVYKSGGRQPAVVPETALASTLPQSRGSLSTVRSPTPVQSR